MPAFTFEKISPPPRGAPPVSPLLSQPTPQSESQRLKDNVIQVLGRFVVARVREDKPAPQQSSSK